MDFNATVDLIIKDLKDAGEIIDDLKNYQGVPLLQIELAKSKCRNAAEVIALLKSLDNIYTPVKKEVADEKLKKPGAEDRYIESPDGSAKQTKESETEKSETKNILKKPGESAIIADTFTNLHSNLNEQLGSLRDEDDFTEILKAKPLKNLSEAIGVNDKFLFIREIFNGNPESYNQAISRLDGAENISDARAVIMSYTGNNLENETVKQLLDLLKRKFPADE